MTAFRREHKVSDYGPPFQCPRLIVGARVRSFGRTASVRVDDTANAVLCGNDGRIMAVGRADAIRAPGAEVLELPGATLTPGLTDAHIHLTEWALSRRQVDLADARTPEEAARRVAEHTAGRRDARRGRPPAPLAEAPVRHAAHADGWVSGRGWSRERWAGAEPDRGVLDAWLPDTPVALQSHDMHALWVNSAALHHARISAGTPDPPGGRIVRDADGEPTGLLLESAGQLVIRHIPEPTDAEMLDAVLAAQARLHCLGITGVHSLPGIAVPRPDPLSVLEKLRAQDRLRLRVLQHLPLEFLEDAIRLGLRSGFGGDWIRIGGIKMFLDGSLGSRTAWMREPYEDASRGSAPPSLPPPAGGRGTGSRAESGPAGGRGSADCGVNVLSADVFRAAVRRAAEAGLASAVHAIGDAAVALAIDVLADPAVRVEAIPHRIEHVQCLPCDRELGTRSANGPGGEGWGAHSELGTRNRLDALAGAGIICSVQPAHLITDWRAADRHWGSARAARTYAFRSMLGAGAVIACGSDAPVEPVDPRLGLFAAVTRMDLERNPAGGWHPAQRIGIDDVFRGYTLGPALAAGRRGHEGVLAPAALADIVAWNADPLDHEVDPLELECVATTVGGEPVYVQ